MKTVSVLMSTYRGESPTNLWESLESLYAQTAPPNQIVLVVDGPIPAEQDDVINRFQIDRRVDELTIIRIPANKGLAGALNAGLPACSGEYIARMDSDDISAPDRLSDQLAYATAHPEIDVISSWSQEFSSIPPRVRIKASPVGHADIVMSLRWRNVLVHPSVVVRANALRAVEGYRSTYRLLEDYDLFVRLANAGYRFHVIPKALVKVRTSPQQSLRRGGVKYCINEVAFRLECVRVGFISLSEFFATVGLYAAFRLFPGRLRARIYAIARS